MKRQIRHGLFETNSSSTHSITITNKSDYDKWTSGEGYLYTGWGWGWDYDKPTDGKIYTLEEVISFMKRNKYHLNDDFEDMKEDERDDVFADNSFFSIERYNDYCEDYEEFEETYTTESGDTVVAFGYYGYDC